MSQEALIDPSRFYHKKDESSANVFLTASEPKNSNSATSVANMVAVVEAIRIASAVKDNVLHVVFAAIHQRCLVTSQSVKTNNRTCSSGREPLESHAQNGADQHLELWPLHSQGQLVPLRNLSLRPTEARCWRIG
uniref:Uncharacterized protein n=1 Tax=Steinernema glaseri TaxID=37863 RepID=A0A1I7ZGX0_9BILA